MARDSMDENAPGAAHLQNLAAMNARVYDMTEEEQRRWYAEHPVSMYARDICLRCAGKGTTLLADTDLPDTPANRLTVPRKCPRCRGTGRVGGKP